MNDETHNEPDRIEQYLDGAMTRDQRERFERDLDGSDDLRRELEMQLRIDESLRATFMPASPPDVRALFNGRHAPGVNGRAPARVTPAPGAEPEQPKPRLRRFPAMLAIAACIGLLIGGVVIGAMFMQSGGARSLPNQFTRVSASDFYANLRKQGFVFDHACDSDAEFREYTQQRLGTPVQLAVAPADVTIRGWVGYNDAPGFVVSKHQSTMLARVGGTDVAVLFDTLEHDSTVERSGGINVHRRVVGGIVLYELSPLEEARVLPLVEKPG